MSKRNWFAPLVFGAMVVVATAANAADEMRTQWCENINAAIAQFIDAQAAERDFNAWVAEQADSVPQDHVAMVRKMIALYFVSTDDPKAALEACERNEQGS